MRQTFKITNSTSRTAFKSLKQVEEYIRTKKPPINAGDTSYKIVETVEKLHEIKCETEELSQENKDKLWEEFIQGLDNLNGSLSIIMYILKDYYNSERTIGKIKHGRIFPRELTTIEELNKVNEKDSTELRKFFKELILNNYKSWKEDESKYEYLRVATDYKPCNAKAISFKNGFMGGLNLLVRESDVVMDSFVIYGRNVNHRGTYRLTNDDFK
jgi:hypothetical protein